MALHDSLARDRHRHATPTESRATWVASRAVLRAHVALGHADLHATRRRLTRGHELLTLAEERARARHALLGALATGEPPGAR